jgi:hypothetical protein
MNSKKVLLYCVFAFDISWLSALFFFLSGREYGSTLSQIGVATLYIPGPAFATLIVQKGFYKQKLSDYGLRLKHISVNWTLLIPVLFLGLIPLTYFTIQLGSLLESRFGQLIFSSDFIANKLRELAAQSGVESISLPEVGPATFILAILAAGMIAGFTINLPFMLGEELGWRGLMTAETKGLGFWKFNLLIGTTWGLWHAPIILMGHNYPYYPYIGIFMMVLFCIPLSFIFAYIRYKSRTVFGPCIIHGMINATGALFLFTVAGGHELFSSIAGWAGIIASLLLSIIIALSDPKLSTAIHSKDAVACRKHTSHRGKRPDKTEWIFFYQHCHYIFKEIT